MKKEKLTIEKLTPYLPYKLKWSLQGLSIFTMSGLTEEALYTEEGTVLTWTKHDDLPQALFPILRPLSSLTKQIEVNGEKIVPINELNKIDSEYNIGIDDGYLFFEDICNINMLELNRVKKFYDWLYKHHFAVNIPEHLYIDINTI